MNMERSAPQNQWLKLVLYAFHGLHWSFIFAPVFWTLSVLALAVRLRSAWGHWPRPMVDPIRIPEADLYFRFMELMTFISLASIPIVLVLALALWWSDPQTKQRWRLLALFGAWGLTFFLIALDPWDIFEWFFD